MHYLRRVKSYRGSLTPSDLKRLLDESEDTKYQGDCDGSRHREKESGAET